MSSPKAVLGAAVLSTDTVALAALSPARAAASRANGAKSRGPKTPEGKARSAQNALKHGLRAEKFVVVRGEDPEQFRALEKALAAELAPDGVLQGLLAGRIARAAWRLERAERIESELFARLAYDNANLGLAMIRDGNGSRSLDTVLRYRGTALAELWRALRLLKALQSEPAARAVPGTVALEKPIEPEDRENPGDPVPATPADEPQADISGRPDTDDAAPEHDARPEPRKHPPASSETPNEPKARRDPSVPAAAPIVAKHGVHPPRPQGGHALHARAQGLASKEMLKLRA